MTLNDAIKRVKDRSHKGDPDITSDALTAQIIRAVNDARREVIRVIPKQWLRSTTTVVTVSGTSTYSLPSNCQEPVLFRYTTGGADYFLSKVPSEREFYQDLYGSTISNNKPLYFLDTGTDSTTGYRQVQMFPTPDAAYTINVVYMVDPTVTDLSTSDLSTDLNPPFPSYVQDQLWKGALYHFLKSFDDPGQGVAKADYDASVLAAEEADERDLDADLAMRFDVGRRVTDFRSPETGIRLK